MRVLLINQFFGPIPRPRAYCSKTWPLSSPRVAVTSPFFAARHGITGVVSTPASGLPSGLCECLRGVTRADLPVGC